MLIIKYRMCVINLGHIIMLQFTLILKHNLLSSTAASTLWLHVPGGLPRGQYNWELGLRGQYGRNS